MDIDDNSLLAAVVAGDDHALKDLFDRHAPWLARRLRRLMPDDTDAVEDVLQDTFIAVWRGAARYAGTGDVGAWIWGVARRQAGLWARRAGHEVPISDIADITDVRAAADDPATLTARRIDLQRAFAVLGSGTAAQREIARLVLLEDRPMADVAAHLGVPVGTVKSRVFKVRRLLQAALRREVE